MAKELVAATRLDLQELRTVRLGARVKGCSVSEFLRDVAVPAAQQLLLREPEAPR